MTGTSPRKELAPTPGPATTDSPVAAPRTVPSAPHPRRAAIRWRSVTSSASGTRRSTRLSSFCTLHRCPGPVEATTAVTTAQRQTIANAMVPTSLTVMSVLPAITSLY